MTQKHSVLNQNKISELHSLSDPQDEIPFLDDLIETFEASVTVLLVKVRDEYSRQKFEAASNAAHAIKGAAANIGADSLSECARTFENDASDGRTQNLAKTLEEMEKSYQLAAHELRTHWYKRAART